MATTRFSKIQWGDGLAVTDQGDGVIRVDSGGGTGPAGPPGDTGPQGDPGVGVPAGGIAGQVLTKESGTDYDADWETPTGGGGGAGPSDTAAWMPLTSTISGDDVLVFDADHSLIPTLISF